MSNVVPFMRGGRKAPTPEEDDGGIPYGALLAGTSGDAFSIYYIASEKEFMLVNNVDDTAVAFHPKQLLTLLSVTQEVAAKVLEEGLDGFVELEDS